MSHSAHIRSLPVCGRSQRNLVSLTFPSACFPHGSWKGGTVRAPGNRVWGSGSSTVGKNARTLSITKTLVNRWRLLPAGLQALSS